MKNKVAIGLLLGVLLFVGTAATVYTGYRTTTALSTNFVSVINYTRGTSGVIYAIHPTNFLTGLMALPNWPASGAGDVTTLQLNAATNFVYTNLAVGITNLQGGTNGINTRVGNLEGATNGMNSRISSIEGQTNTLGSRATSLEGQTNTLGSRATSLEGQTNTLGSRATSLEGQTNTLSTRLSTVEGQTNNFVKTIDTRGQTNSNARFSSTIFATGLSSNNTTVSTIGKTSSGELVETADYNLIFGNGTQASTNGNDITLSVVNYMAISNTLWFLSNIVVVANVTNATSGDVTNTISLAPGEIEEIAYETNATVRNTNISGYVANTKSKWARYILTGPSAITATFNTGAVHGLYWGRNSNNIVDASMTLAANSRYLYSGSRWGSNILQSLIKVDQ
jgi:TolA-binding protein